MADTIAVVALGTLDTVPAQVAHTTAGVARPLLLLASAERTEAAAAALGARTRDVAGLAAFVARPAGARVVGAGRTGLFGAVAGLEEM